MKVIFISDNLAQYHTFVRSENMYDFQLDLFNHVEVNQRAIQKVYYDLFIVDVAEPLLAVPPWIREQVQHQYYYQVIFISDYALPPAIEYFLDPHIFKVINHQTAIDSLEDVVVEVRNYVPESRYTRSANFAKKKNFINSLLGNHSSIKKTNDFIKIVSKAPNAPCLIRGESGTGKNFCARMIHKTSNLRDELFYVKNCENTTTTEFLRDFFGSEDSNNKDHENGKGLLEKYSGGTIVLKNIEKLPREIQDKLYLVFEERAFKPPAANRLVEVDLRLIGTTKLNLEWFVKNQNFNSDLYYHLNAFEMVLPPLRERQQDIELLARYYMQYYNYLYGKNIKEFTPSALKVLIDYKWPGNIKELKDVVEKAVFASTSQQITNTLLSEHLIFDYKVTQEEEYFGNCTIKELEKIHIEHVLQRTKGNKSKAAGVLDISRTTLREKMRQYEIE